MWTLKCHKTFYSNFSSFHRLVSWLSRVAARYGPCLGLWLRLGRGGGGLVGWLGQLSTFMLSPRCEVTRYAARIYADKFLSLYDKLIMCQPRRRPDKGQGDRETGRQGDWGTGTHSYIASGSVLFIEIFIVVGKVFSVDFSADLL